MRFLILAALLAVAASHTTWGNNRYYGGYPSSTYSYGSYGSYGYPSSYYGTGYGSGIYGTGYGSGYGYGNGYKSYGGTGRSYYGGSYGGAYAYKPTVYNTARYSYSKYPYGSGEYYGGGGIQGFTSTSGPGKISFTKEVGSSGQSAGYITGAPVVSVVDGVKTAGLTKTSGAWIQGPSYQGDTYGSSYETGTHGSGYHVGADGTSAVGGPGKISFTRGVSQVSSGLQGSQGTGVIGKEKVSPIKVTDQFSSGYKTGQQVAAYGLKTTGGHLGQTQTTFTQDFSKIAGQSGTPAFRLETHPYDKLVAPEVVAVVPGSSSGLGKSQGAGVHFVKTTGGQAHGSFIQDVSGVKDQTGFTIIEPEVDTFDKVVAVPPKPVSRPTTVVRGAHKGGAQIVGTSGYQRQVEVVQDITKTQHTGAYVPVKPAIHRPVSRPESVVGDAHKGGAQTVGTSGYQRQVEVVQDITRTEHTGAYVPVKPATHRPVSRPTIILGDAHKGGAQTVGTSGYQRQVEVVQDFTRTGHTGAYVPVKPIIHRPVSRPTIVVGDAHKGGAQTVGTGGYQRQVEVVQDFTRTGNTGAYVPVKPAIHRQSSRYTQRFGSAHRGQSHGVPSIGGPRISFIMGHAGQGGNTLTTFDRPAVPAIASRQPYGHSRVTGSVSKVTQDFSTPVVPSRISFTQGITSQHTTGIKPVISTFDKPSSPRFPAPIAFQEQHLNKKNQVFLTSPVKPAQVVAEVKPGFTTSQQPVPGQVVYKEEKYYTENISPVGVSAGHAIGGVSSLVAGQAPTVLGHSSDYKHGVGALGAQAITGRSPYVDNKAFGFKQTSIVDRGVHQTTAVVDGQTGEVSAFQLTPGGHAGDKSAYLEVPVAGFDNEKSSVFFQSSGVAPAGNLVENKGSPFQPSPVISNAGIIGGRSQGYTGITQPFKSYYSSWYPGYSHVSGESPRYEHSADKNLLYSYTSPYLVSPFSYTYASGSKYYNQNPIV